MSNNIYDILSKLPKDNLVSVVEAEPIYESIDSQDNLSGTVLCLEEKFKKFNPNDEDETKYLNPQAKRFVQLAKAKFPETSSDLEAVVASIGDKTEELDQRDKDTAEWISKAKATIGQQQREIEQTEQAVTDANARYDAQEKRFQDFNRQVAAAELDVKQQAQAALDYAQQPEAQPQAVIKQVQAQQPAAEPEPLPDVTVAQPAPVQQQPEPEQKSADTPPSNVVTLKQPKKSAGTGKVSKEVKQDVNALWAAESKTHKKKMLEQQDLASGIANTNWQIIQNNRLVPPPSTELIFGDKVLPLKPLDVQAIWTHLMKKSTRNIGKADQFTDEQMLNNLVRSTLNNPITVNYLLGTKDIASIQKVLRGMQTKLRKAKQTPMDLDQPEQPAQQPQKTPAQQPQQTQQPGLASTNFGKYIQQKATEPPRQGDLFGTPNMNETINKLATSLMERFANFKEDAKPDFLDLDKDGDTDEPMKSAAKSAKDDEPAKPDSDAVAKRKRLQALKDKQEDERAEKGDYDSKSSTRKIKGRAYGGSAQKDDEEKDLDEGNELAPLAPKPEDFTNYTDYCKAYRTYLDKWHDYFQKSTTRAFAQQKERARKLGVDLPDFKLNDNNDLDESGLQAYLGKKKYGKEGMKALQKAGREGAGKETMAKLRAKHDKMDEARPSRADKVTKDLTSIADKKGYKSAKDFTRQDWDKVAKPHGYTGKEIAAVRGHKVEEVAPPGAKAERMVKHIKKGYAKDGNLSKKEKGIAYATAWKAKKAGKLEESRNAESSEYTYETIGRVLCDEQPHLDANSEAFVKAVYDELIEMKLTPKAARWLVHYDEDFISDCATSYGHFCASKEKEAMECGSPMNAFVSEEPMVDAVQELDEIARLAGLAPKMEAKCSSCGCADCKCNESSCMIDEEAINEAATRKDFRMVAELLKDIPDMAKRTELALYHADIFKEQNPRFKKEMFLAAAGVDTTPIKDAEDEVLIDEEEMGEGNEFSGALAAAKAAGEKEFEVDGKKYTVKEDININVSANGEEDVVNLIRKLSGMPVVAIQAQPAVAEEIVAEEGPKERDVEYTNTPREEVAGTDAAIPSGTDLNRAKRQFKKEYPGDNPMAVAEAKEEKLWQAYESMINDVKA
jgi:hypothetical protein